MEIYSVCVLFCVFLESTIVCISVSIIVCTHFCVSIIVHFLRFLSGLVWYVLQNILRSLESGNLHIIVYS